MFDTDQGRLRFKIKKKKKRFPPEAADYEDESTMLIAQLWFFVPCVDPAVT